MYLDPGSYVEGVPVKVSEKFRPPRRVTLPAACNYQVNIEALTEEYDFIYEQETLQYVQNSKKKRNALLQLRVGNIQSFEEEKERFRLKQIEEEKERKAKEELEQEEARKLQAEEESSKLQGEEDDDISAENRKSLSEQESADPDDAEISTIKSREGITESVNKTDDEELKQDVAISDELKSKAEIMRNKNGFSYGKDLSIVDPGHSSVLVPTQCNSQGLMDGSSVSTNSKINFADFEGDASDPFDSAALKSINDMEELAKVLQSSQVNQQNVVDTQNPNYQGNNFYTQRDYQMYPQHQANFLPNSQHYETAYQSSMIPAANSNPVPSPVANTNIHVQPNDYSNSYYGLGWTVNEPANKPTVSYSYNYPSRLTTPQQQSGVIDNVPISLMGASSNIIGNNLAASNSANAGIMPVSKRQDLEDFYSRYYAFQKFTSNIEPHSGENTPTVTQSTTKSLRSCSSVPDLTATEDAEVSNLTAVLNIRTSNKSISKTPPIRSSSTSFAVQENDLSSDPFISALASPPLKLKLPDPFTELTSDAQALVQDMSEMGFPRARVARAVQKLGTDHKKLVEVLLTLQSLQDGGEDEYRSERSFYYFMGDMEKVNEFLSNSKQLLNLGFKEENIIESLFKHNNDQAKTLEELIL